MLTQSPQFNAWLDDFFTAYYRNRPVNATFIGNHAYDSNLPDFSENGAGDTLAEMENLLSRLNAFPDEPLSSIERIDRRLAEGFLEIQCWEYRSQHFQRGNPCSYTDEAIFSLIALFLSPFAPLAERVESAIARMKAIPVFLEQGQANVRQSPTAWTERAIRECDGALAFLEDGVEHLIVDEGVSDAEAFRASAQQAAQAFRRFQHYLREWLLAQPTHEVACGAEPFDLLMRKGHFIDLDGEAIAAYAEEQLSVAQAYLEEHAADFGASSPEEALERLTALHPSVEGYLARYTELWEASRTVADRYELVTWPDFPIRYIPQPRWARRAAPYLYFLFYRAPAAFHRPPVHNYLVTPIEADLPDQEQEKLLRSNNDSVIKLNHVVHHGGIGHHVQNWNAYHSASRIGQMAAVDCASRIAMFCGGTMAEGWAVYATDLISETGFLTPLEQYSEYQTRRRMCARAVVDVRLHQGQFSLEEAARYYEQRAGMNPGFAMSEAVKNSMFPGGAVMYILGCDHIHSLRHDLSARLGSRFNLRKFHDQLLSYGSIPVELAAKEMEKEFEDAAN